MTDKKLRSLWPWNKLQQEDSGKNTTPPNDEDVLSEEYDSEKEGENPATANYPESIRRRYNELDDVILKGLTNASGFDIDEAERLLRENSTGDDISRSDMLAALVNSHPPPKEDFEQIFEQLTSRVGDTLFAEDIDGCNAAHRACISHIQDTAALLFLCEMARRKPQVLGQTTGEAHKQRTYLHLAAEKKSHRVVEWLLKVNVNVEQNDMDGKTAWDVAFEKDDGVVMSMFAMRLVARQIDTEEAKNNETKVNETKSAGTKTDEAKSTENRDNDIPSDEVRYEEARGEDVERNEAESNGAKSAEVEIGQNKGEKFKSSEARRHWFRMNSGYPCFSLEKRSELPDETDERDHAKFKLFTISENNHIWTMALLRLICEKEKFDDEKTRRYLSFLQKHFRDTSILSTRFPARRPTAAFEDFWWTIGRNRKNSDEHMRMISIAMPYLCSASWRSVGNRSSLHEQKTTSTICPDGKNSTHGLLLPLTLDEYCNPSLSVVTLSVRDKDQVVVRVAPKRQEDTKPTRIEPTSTKKIRPET